MYLRGETGCNGSRYKAESLEALAQGNALWRDDYYKPHRPERALAK